MSSNIIQQLNLLVPMSAMLGALHCTYLLSSWQFHFAIPYIMEVFLQLTIVYSAHHQSKYVIMGNVNVAQHVVLAVNNFFRTHWVKVNLILSLHEMHCCDFWCLFEVYFESKWSYHNKLILNQTKKFFLATLVSVPSCIEESNSFQFGTVLKVS